MAKRYSVAQAAEIIANFAAGEDDDDGDDEDEEDDDNVQGAPKKMAPLATLR